MKKLIMSFCLNEIITDNNNKLSIYVAGDIVTGDNVDDLKKNVYIAALSEARHYSYSKGATLKIEQIGDDWETFSVYAYE